jgi:hypothetical protein
MEASYQKQMIVNCLPLPADIIENEIKSYMFHDKISSDAKKKKQILTEKFKANIMSTRSNFFGSQNEADTEEDTDTHWAIGFTDRDDNNLQLQADNCERCGNYLIFGSMFRFTPSQLDNVVCRCEESPIEIMWDDEQQGDVMDYESQTTQDTIIDHYDDEDTEWDEEYAG